MGVQRTGPPMNSKNNGSRNEEIGSVLFEEGTNDFWGERRRCGRKDDTERRLRLRGAAGRMTNPSIVRAKFVSRVARKACTRGRWEESDNTLQYRTRSQRRRTLR